MIKFLYYLRAFFISFECLTILVSGLVYICWGNKLHFDKENLNKEAIQWIALLPFSVCVWTVIEAREILYPNDEAAKILNKWPDYWKLEAHFYVGVVFCALFFIPLLFIWLLNGLDTLKGVWMFFTLMISLLANAASFYLAKTQLMSILAR